MKRFVNGEEVNLEDGKAEILALSDRLIVKTESGAFSAVVFRTKSETLISYKGCQYRIEERNSKVRTVAREGSGELRAPMPGQIVDVRHGVGDLVRKGDAILILEAMKTQQPFTAPFDGLLKQLSVKVGAQVSEGDILAIIERLVPGND